MNLNYHQHYFFKIKHKFHDTAKYRGSYISPSDIFFITKIISVNSNKAKSFENDILIFPFVYVVLILNIKCLDSKQRLERIWRRVGASDY